MKFNIKSNRLSFSVLLLSFVLLISLVVFLYKNTPSEEQFFRRKESLSAIAGQTKGEQVDDRSIVSRIVKSYQLAIEEQESLGKSMWQYIFDQKHKNIHEIFKNGQEDAAAAILRDPGSSELFYGIDSLVASLQPQMQAQNYAVLCLDCLVRFAEAIGAVRLQNPEGVYRPPLSWNGDVILERVVKVLGYPISFPNPYPNEYGLSTSQGIISYRVPQALYQAWRIKQHVKGIQNPRVLEIGAGVGRTAFFARQLGIEDYTIVDLPITEISSEYFLSRAIGEDHVQLHGEKRPNAERSIKFLTPAEFMAGNSSYDLIINVDSLTEMDPDTARAYWKKIEASTGKFLSINHEFNPFTVKELIDESSSVVQADRMLNSMRRGYVEEYVQFRQ